MTRRLHTITAIIYDRKGKVLSIGKNSYFKTHPLQAKYAIMAGEDYKIFQHAEINAIIKLKANVSAHRISIFRYHQNGKPAMASPCRICQSAIEAAGIKVVDHT